jgi:hypothetical protein
MSHFYPARAFGPADRVRLTVGLTPSLLHHRYGLDYGERFHRDIAWRMRALMEVDRQVFAEFGGLGLGFREPFPRATIEPFGHRWVPAMYGCEVQYAANEDPASHRVPFTRDGVRGLAAWTRERFDAAEPVRVVLEQARWAREHADRAEAERRLGFNPHAQPLTSLQNLGSVINTAVSVFGEDALLLSMDEPALLRAFYANVTELMVLSLEVFPGVDGRRLSTIFVGNCSVAMISPGQYLACNRAFDAALLAYARRIGARFMVHQDSGATSHLEAYAGLGLVDAIDFGQDTDWEKAAQLFPRAQASCILFPAWLRSHSREELRDELSRLLRAGRAFPSFTFTLLELDVELAGDPLRILYEELERAAEAAA